MRDRGEPLVKTIRHAWRAYLVRCADGSVYAGVTNDVARRLAAHNAGRGARYTRSRRPVALAWRSSRLEKSAAHRLEARLKRLERADKLALAGPATAARRRLVRALLVGLRSPSH
jgi:putative endonuclease